MLVSELKRMRLMMSLCKIKLIQYQDVLAKSVPVDDDEAVRALEGIGEVRDEATVCSLRSGWVIFNATLFAFS